MSRINRNSLRGLWRALGPGLVTGAADDDPSGIATYSQGGAQFGYALGWVVLTANLFAMLIQTLSAKLGIATGQSLPEVCRARLLLATGSEPRRLSVPGAELDGIHHLRTFADSDALAGIARCPNHWRNTPGLRAE